MPPGYYDSTGKWVTTQYDPQAAPGDNDRPARGEGGLGSTAASDVNGALAKNGQAPAVPDKHPLGSIPNYDYNLAEAKRLAQAAAAWKPTATAGQAGPVYMDRSAELASRTHQMNTLGSLQQQAQGGGPNVSAGINRGAMDAALRSSMGPRTAGGLGARASMGAGAAMFGDQSMKGAASTAAEQQQAWQALHAGAFGTRAGDIAANTEQAKIDQMLAMGNAGNRQAVSLGNQNAGLQGLANQIAGASQVGGIVNDGVSTDLAYRDFLAGIERNRRAIRDRDNELDQQRAAGAVGTGMNLMTAGAGSGAVSSAQSSRAAGAKKA